MEMICPSRFASRPKLPIIQTIPFKILRFYGYDDKKERAANLHFLARRQSPLIRSLPTSWSFLWRRVSLDRRARPSVLHFDVFIMVVVGSVCLHY